MTKRQQQIVAVAVLAAVVVLAGAYFFAIKPQMNNRQANQDAAIAAEQEVATLQATLVELRRKEAELPQAQEAVDELNRRFPSTFQQDRWLDSVRTVAGRSGVELSAISPTVPAFASEADPDAPAVALDPESPAVAAGPGLIAEVSVTINASGSKRALTQFLAGLENMERPLLAESVAISGREGASSEGTLTLTGKTFLSREMDSPPAGASGQ